MTYRPFIVHAPYPGPETCPKCGARKRGDFPLRYHRTKHAEVFEETLGEPTVLEHIDVTCIRCDYVWSVATKDAEETWDPTK